jgi:thiamine-monophosphate kinase
MIDQPAPFTPLSQVGEWGLIAKLQHIIGPPASPEVVQGIGDDAAVLDIGGPELLLVSTDLLIEGVHFDPTYCPLKYVGYKSIAVNASDIYAMNGTPLAVTVGLAVNEKYSIEAIEAIYTGIQLAAVEYGLSVIGGDTTAAPSGLQIAITVLGQVKKDQVVYRSGAQVNDLICISGDVGSAYAGFMILEREKQVFKTNPGIQPDVVPYEYVVQRQLRPEARKDVIELLAQLNIKPTAMIDLSDGLATAIHSIAHSSQIGAQIYQDRLPIDYQTIRVAEEFEAPATNFGLFGGEDYELLFTLAQADYDKISDHTLFSIIGFVSDVNTGVRLVQSDDTLIDLPLVGWEHFQSK